MPLEGVRPGIRCIGRMGLQQGGGDITSDAEGRVTWQGLSPGETYEALGFDNESNPIGRSQPFTGEPGETVHDLLVVCSFLGGIEGNLLDSYGVPIAHADIQYTALLEDGTVYELQKTTTDSNGMFCILDALPDGLHPNVFVGRQTEDGLEVAVIENVDVVPGAVTDLGTIRLDQQFKSIEEAEQQLVGTE